MSKSAGADHRAGLLPWTRVLFVATIVGALGLGFVGIRQYLTAVHDPDLDQGLWNVVYYDLQLFVLGSQPLQHPGPYPWPLDVARFAAPAASVYALFEAGRALFDRQYRRWRRRRQQGHAIVTGDSAASQAFLARLRRDDPRTVQVKVPDPDALLDAGIAGADLLYICVDHSVDGISSLTTASAAATSLRDSEARLRIYAQVGDSELALALRARRLGLPEPTNVHLDFFNIEELAARHLLSDQDVQVEPGQPPKIIVAGLGTFGRAIIVEFARYWQLHSPRRAERVAVMMIGPQAQQVSDDLAARWDVVSAVCDMTTLDDVATAMDLGVGDPPHRVFICHEDEEHALRTALTTVELWRGGKESLVVRLDRLDRHSAAFDSSRPLLDTIGGRLRLVSIAKLAAEQDFAKEDLVEWLAQSIHRVYLLEQISRGVPMGQTAAMRPWSDLAEDLKRANRSQAADIGRKLELAGCSLAPRTRRDCFAFPESEVEILARAEHTRWAAERRSSGWVHGEDRNDKKKVHPSLVSWEALSESEREKDRDTIRSLPAVLADVGLRIVRLVR